VVRKERAVRERTAELNGRKLEASLQLTTVRKQLSDMASSPPRSLGGRHGAHASASKRYSLLSMEARYIKQLQAWEAKKAAILAERERTLEMALNAMSIIVSYGKPHEKTKALASRMTRNAAPISFVRLGTKLDASAIGQRGWAVPIVLAPGGPTVPVLTTQDTLGTWHSPVDEAPTPGRKQTLAPIVQLVPAQSPGRVVGNRAAGNRAARRASGRAGDNGHASPADHSSSPELSLPAFTIRSHGAMETSPLLGSRVPRPSPPRS
jgi:hypothetical protein